MRKISYILFVVTSIYVYRHELFDLAVTYEADEVLPITDLVDLNLMSDVDSIVEANGYYGVVFFNQRLLNYTSSKLRFGQNQSFTNANDLNENATAHCVGYASFHASILRYALKSKGIDAFKIRHVRGHIEVMGINLNNLFPSSFFKTHDFVEIRSTEINEFYYCDPSLYEFAIIYKIDLKQNMLYQ